LAGEGFRFFDLVRTGKAAQEIGICCWKKWLFPIPAEEIQFSSGTGHKTLIIKSIIMKK
jgi:hypothetical protein